MAELTGPNQKLRDEFNDWAARGKAESMERHHAAITTRAIERMAVLPGDRVLDLGCGSGWAARALAPRVGPRGLVVGVDVSDAMIGKAWQSGAVHPNVRYLCAPAEHIPFEDGFFTHVLSVESFYYHADQRAVLEELRRVVAPGGELFVLICVFEGSPGAREWPAKLAVPVHVRSAEEYVAMLGEAGWGNARAELFAPPENEASGATPDAHEYALLLSAAKC